MTAPPRERLRSERGTGDAQPEAGSAYDALSPVGWVEPPLGETQRPRNVAVGSREELDPTYGTGTCAKQEAGSAYDALSAKHKAFVDAYCKCWNACHAARAAGYSESTANSHAYHVLRRDDIEAAIEERKREPARRAYALLKPGYKAFLDAYCRSWNAGEAGVAAGYGPHSGYRLLRRDDVRAALIERQALAAASKEVEISEVVATLTRVLRANMLDYMSIDAEGRLHVDFARLTRDQASVISELNVETRRTAGQGKRRPAAEVEKLRFKLHDKLRAADRLLRHLCAVKPTGAAPAEPAAPPAKPVTHRDRAKAILALLAKARKEAEESAE